MDAFWKQVLWEQFGAAIWMLRNALVECPNEMWEYRMWTEHPELPYLGQFWYEAYHVLFWLNLFLTGKEEGFKAPEALQRRPGDAPPPWTFTAEAYSRPARVYSKAELLSWLDESFEKCKTMIEGLTEERAKAKVEIPWLGFSYYELQLYSMRHVQEHSGQLAMTLGQAQPYLKDWVVSVSRKDEEEE